MSYVDELKIDSEMIVRTGTGLCSVCQQERCIGHFNIVGKSQLRVKRLIAQELAKFTKRKFVPANNELHMIAGKNEGDMALVLEKEKTHRKNYALVMLSEERVEELFAKSGLQFV